MKIKSTSKNKLLGQANKDRRQTAASKFNDNQSFYRFRINYLLAAMIGIVFILLMLIFAAGLSANPNKLDFVVKGEKIPMFTLPELRTDNDSKQLQHTDLTSNKPYYLVNFWGSWCVSCYQEHPYLHKLGETETIYGINWKDQRKSALKFLQQGGNPFKNIIIDANSHLAIGMGVAAAPETFLVAADGTMIYRHAGIMTPTIWEQQFLPKIQAIKRK